MHTYIHTYLHTYIHTHTHPRLCHIDFWNGGERAFFLFTDCPEMSMCSYSYSSQRCLASDRVQTDRVQTEAEAQTDRQTGSTSVDHSHVLPQEHIIILHIFCTVSSLYSLSLFSPAFVVIHNGIITNYKELKKYLVSPLPSMYFCSFTISVSRLFWVKPLVMVRDMIRSVIGFQAFCHAKLCL